MARLQEITMTRGNRLLLALALAAGVVAAVLVFVALSQSSDDGGTVSGGGANTVVVAARDIDAGTEITSDMVKVIEVSDDLLISGAATDTNVIVGQAARVKIFENEQIAVSRVGAENDGEGPAFVLPAGMRAISVGVEEVRAVGGLLLPGNRVDVYWSDEDNLEGLTEEVNVYQIMAGIEVLSVAQESQKPQPAAAGTTDGTTATAGELPEEVDEQPDANTVTLIVTPAQAEMLVCAQDDDEDGIWLALRGFGEAPPERATIFNPCTLQAAP